MTYTRSLVDRKRSGAIALRSVMAVGAIVGLGLAVGWQSSRWATSLQHPFPQAHFARDLRSAIRDGDRGKVESLLAQGADVNGRDEAGETPLMQAAVNADADQIRLL